MKAPHVGRTIPPRPSLRAVVTTFPVQVVLGKFRVMLISGASTYPPRYLTCQSQLEED